MATAETLKNPEFILVEKHGDIEVREYSEYVIAKTSISQSDMELNNNMFRTLAGYIFGGNNLSLIHISEPTRRTPISYAVFCLKK